MRIKAVFVALALCCIFGSSPDVALAQPFEPPSGPSPAPIEGEDYEYVFGDYNDPRFYDKDEKIENGLIGYMLFGRFNKREVYEVAKSVIYNVVRFFGAQPSHHYENPYWSRQALLNEYALGFHLKIVNYSTKINNIDVFTLARRLFDAIATANIVIAALIISLQIVRSNALHSSFGQAHAIQMLVKWGIFSIVAGSTFHIINTFNGIFNDIIAEICRIAPHYQCKIETPFFIIASTRHPNDPLPFLIMGDLLHVYNILALLSARFVREVFGVLVVAFAPAAISFLLYDNELRIITGSWIKMYINYILLFFILSGLLVVVDPLLKYYSVDIGSEAFAWLGFRRFIGATMASGISLLFLALTLKMLVFSGVSLAKQTAAAVVGQGASGRAASTGPNRNTDGLAPANAAALSYMPFASRLLGERQDEKAEHAAAATEEGSSDAVFNGYHISPRLLPHVKNNHVNGSGDGGDGAGDAVERRKGYQPGPGDFLQRLSADKQAAHSSVRLLAWGKLNEVRGRSIDAFARSSGFRSKWDMLHYADGLAAADEYDGNAPGDWHSSDASSSAHPFSRQLVTQFSARKSSNHHEYDAAGDGENSIAHTAIAVEVAYSAFNRMKAAANRRQSRATYGEETGDLEMTALEGVRRWDGNTPGFKSSSLKNGHTKAAVNRRQSRATYGEEIGDLEMTALESVRRWGGNMPNFQSSSRKNGSRNFYKALMKFARSETQDGISQALISAGELQGGPDMQASMFGVQPAGALNPSPGEPTANQFSAVHPLTSVHSEMQDGIPQALIGAGELQGGPDMQTPMLGVQPAGALNPSPGESTANQFSAVHPFTDEHVPVAQLTQIVQEADAVAEMSAIFEIAVNVCSQTVGHWSLLAGNYTQDDKSMADALERFHKSESAAQALAVVAALVKNRIEEREVGEEEIEFIASTDEGSRLRGLFYYYAHANDIFIGEIIQAREMETERSSLGSSDAIPPFAPDTSYLAAQDYESHAMNDEESPKPPADSWFDSWSDLTSRCRAEDMLGDLFITLSQNKSSKADSAEENLVDCALAAIASSINQTVYPPPFLSFIHEVKEGSDFASFFNSENNLDHSRMEEFFRQVHAKWQAAEGEDAGDGTPQRKEGDHLTEEIDLFRVAITGRS